MVQRAALIREKFHLDHFTYGGLAEYYRRLGVTYRKPQIIYRYKERNQATIVSKQKEFATRLALALKDGLAEVLYIDETTFNLWQSPGRCWVTPGLTLSIPDKRGPSFTVIGALSSQRGLLYYDVFPGSNNASRFAEFID